MAEHVADRAIRNALVHLGLTQGVEPQSNVAMEYLRHYEVIDRHDPEDFFVQPWKSFTPVEGGEVIAERMNGAKVVSPFDGHIVFPNPDAAIGSEWFYLAKPGSRFDG